jgi:hypothetical protein
MRTRIAAIAALAGSLVFIPVMIDQADAGRGGGRGGMSRGHIGGVGHIRGANVNRGHIAGINRWSGNRWRGASNWNGNNWNKNKFHDHRFNRRFVGFGVGWWPGYYGSYGGCAGLRRQAQITGSAYWWNRYRACVNYD